MCSIALAGFWIGIRFLRFAWSGRTKEGDSLAKAILLGIGSFFPAFTFSLPITMLWVNPRDDGSDLALETSGCIGVGAVIICTIVLLRKRALSHILDEQF